MIADVKKTAEDKMKKTVEALLAGLRPAVTSGPASRIESGSAKVHA